MKKKLITFVLSLFCCIVVYSQEVAPAVNPPASLFYPGELRIPVNKLALKGKELEGEQLFSQELQLDVDLWEKIYAELPSTYSGKILDIDLARKLFPPFDDGLIGANKYSVSTHVPAGQFINYVLNDDIDKIRSTKSHPEIIFVAGGGGSGKSLIMDLLPNEFERADLMLDGTLANKAKARDRINRALNAGFKVTIIYVFRPIELAVQGIVSRALRMGRGVPILIAAEDHFDAQRTVLDLSKEFVDKINILIISNAGGRDDVKVLSIEDLEGLLDQKNFRYQSKDEIMMRAVIAYLDYIKKLSPELKSKLNPDLRAVLEKGMENFSAKAIEGQSEPR